MMLAYGGPQAPRQDFCDSSASHCHCSLPQMLLRDSTHVTKCSTDSSDTVNNVAARCGFESRAVCY